MSEKNTPLQALPPDGADHRVHRIEILISNLLRTGVLSSVLLVVIGLVVTFAQHPEYMSSSTTLHALTHTPPVIAGSLGELLSQTAHLQGEAIITLGLIVLFITPVMRVAVSAVIFIYQRDRIFTIITIVVLLILMTSLFLGKAEG